MPNETVFDSLPEFAWRGQIEKKKINGKYSLSHCVAVEQASSDMDLRLQKNLRNFVDQLNRDATDLDNPLPKFKQ